MVREMVKRHDAGVRDPAHASPGDPLVVNLLGDLRVSIGGTKAQLTEPPFLGTPTPRPRAAAPPPGTARTTSVSRDFLPEQSASPEGCPPPQDASEQTSAAQAPCTTGGLGGSPAAPGGARPSRSRHPPSAARIARIASGSSTVAINRSRPPQRGHASTSRSKARRISAAHAQWRGADFDVSLARSAVRNLERASISRSVAMKLTGHKTEPVYRRYAIVAENDLREAGTKLAAMLGTTPETARSVTIPVTTR
jgi:hypothetical protein